MLLYVLTHISSVVGVVNAVKKIVSDVASRAPIKDDAVALINALIPLASLIPVPGVDVAAVLTEIANSL